MDSSSTRQDYILPDTPPQQDTSFPSYWAAQAARKKKIPSTNSSAAPPAAAAAASDSKESPLKRRGVFVERGMSSEEYIIPDTPPSHLGWAPKRVPLTTISTNKQQGKRKLHFLEEDEEETNFVPSKKRMCENTSMAPLLEEAAARDDDDDDDFIALINKPSPKHGCLSANSGYEDESLCPSMYSYHSSLEEKNKLLATLAEYGIETTVDRVAKKDRIRDWIQSSVIAEGEEEEEEQEQQQAERPQPTGRSVATNNSSSKKTTISRRTMKEGSSSAGTNQTEATSSRSESY
ncbi:uncharacterized protein LOC120351588 [Nilaparvata lugens]|uniref:uncharacterized protein LOC120351588 n=1 Tax=Nilaparvata lugens TaxID=108931 RepID=UPI00193CB0D6|nr:uncharacterized protein LOC120351588 [Nilaparvata lugens]